MGEAEAYRAGLRKALEILGAEPNFPGLPGDEICRALVNRTPVQICRDAGRAWQRAVSTKIMEELNK